MLLGFNEINEFFHHIFDESIEINAEMRLNHPVKKMVIDILNRHFNDIKVRGVSSMNYLFDKNKPSSSLYELWVVYGEVGSEPVTMIPNYISGKTYIFVMVDNIGTDPSLIDERPLYNILKIINALLWGDNPPLDMWLNEEKLMLAAICISGFDGHYLDGLKEYLAEGDDIGENQIDNFEKFIDKAEMYSRSYPCIPAMIENILDDYNGNRTIASKAMELIEKVHNYK